MKLPKSCLGIFKRKLLTKSSVYSYNSQKEGKMKAIVFDFDGTLTKSKKGSNCWYKIWEYIDDLAYDEMLYNMFKKKLIDNDKWFEMIIKRYKEKDVKEAYLEDIANSIELLPGTYQTLKQLHNNGVKIFVLSGGVRQIIEGVLNREKVNKYITSIEAYDLIFEKNGKLTSYAQPNLHNLERKEEYIEQIKTQYGLKSKDILFVGNGSNDETVYKSGVKTLCINPDDADITNKKCWTYGIENCNDLTQILQYCDLEKRL